jgi:serpin B
MTLNGAAGETKEGIKETLHLGDLSDEEINGAYKTLVPFLSNLDPKVALNLANSNWYHQDFTIRESFRKVLLEYYDAEINAANFRDPATKDRINRWIEDKTKGKIKNMLDQIPADAVMYLVNAIYLKATWQYKFEKSGTEKKPFYLTDGSAVQTDMMFSKGMKVRYFGNSTLELVEIPYGNGQFVFSVLLPRDPAGLESLISGLDMASFQNYIQAADTVTPQVYMPKFKIQFKSTLNSILASMGMEQSFTGDADFSALFEETLGLSISRVIHQSFIEVDEEGTEAAAATIVEIGETSAGPEPKPTSINLNRPFAFFIREKHSNTILFAGKLLDPSEE